MAFAHSLTLSTIAGPIPVARERNKKTEPTAACCRTCHFACPWHHTSVRGSTGFHSQQCQSWLALMHALQVCQPRMSHQEHPAAQQLRFCGGRPAALHPCGRCSKRLRHAAVAGELYICNAQTEGGREHRKPERACTCPRPTCVRVCLQSKGCLGVTHPAWPPAWLPPLH